MARIKLIAIDIDGTLVSRADSRIVPLNKPLISEASAAGIHVVLATARLHRSASLFADQLGIPHAIISAAGAIVRLPESDGEIWHQRIDLDPAWRIAEFADTRGCELVTTIGDMTYYKRRPGQFLDALRDDREVVTTNAAAIIGPPTRMLGPGGDAGLGLLKFVVDRFDSQVMVYADYWDGALGSLTMVHKLASKGAALAEVQERLGIAPDETLAIGDGESDIAMFGQASISVAVGGSPAEVQSAATAVGPSAEEGAVAWAIRHFVL